MEPSPLLGLLVAVISIIFLSNVEAEDVEGAIRLVGGANKYEGRVEVFYQGQWGTVCFGGFSHSEEGQVVCRQLGYRNEYQPNTYTTFPVAILYGYYEGSTDIPIHSGYTRCTGSEDRLVDCENWAQDITACDHSDDVGIVCGNGNDRTGDIHLTGAGVGIENEGQINILDDFGQWNTVCQEGWDLQDAGVVCRQLGWPSATEATGGSIYGFPFTEQDETMTNVACEGSENRLLDCPYSVNISYECDQGWRNAGVICGLFEEGAIRLVGGADQYEGRIEVFYEGRWGTVCGLGVEHLSEGQVVCKQLGYTNQYEPNHFTYEPVAMMYNAYFGENDDAPIHSAGPRCRGTEDSLISCESWGSDVTDCDHSQDVGIVCGNGNDTIGSIRLTGAGVGIQSEGQISLLNARGSWINVCHDGWDLIDSDVVCRQLGYRFSTLAVRNSLYGWSFSEQMVKMTGVDCDGSEEQLLDCNYHEVVSEECRSNERDAGVVCASEIIEGTMRLINGSSENEGLLEIFHGGQWGTVCYDESWSEVAATVACRHLRYSTVKSFNTSNVLASGVVQLDAVTCYGYELTLGNCAHGEWSNPSTSCTHDKDIWLICEDEVAGEGDVRLVDGFSASEGRVEYYANGQWKTLCDKIGDIENANVVCRQLGYFAAAEAFGRSYFGGGSEDQPLVTKGCNGYENELSDCNSLFGPTDCITHQFDAGIICTDQVQESGLRLVNGSDYTGGRVEIYQDGTWGYICNTNWRGDDATVACRQMGLGNVRYAYQDYGPGEGPVLLDNVQCVGDEVNITTCQHDSSGDIDCGHQAAVGISCFVQEEPEAGDVRLTGGSSWKHGRVEYYDGDDLSWYGVCKDPSWDENDARVVCNQLGLDFDGDAGDLSPGPHPRNIHDVNCEGTESFFAFCDFDVEENACESEAPSVGVVCVEYDENTLEGDIRLRDGVAYNSGLIEIYHEGTWGYICNTGWSQDEAKVACRQLGYEYVIETNIATPNNGGRTFHLEGVECQGTEDKLIECAHDPWGDITTCYRPVDAAGVSCSHNPTGLEGWAIALIVVFSVAVVGIGGSALGYVIIRKKKKRFV